MINLVVASIGIGLAVSLLFSEVFGLAAGGMVVPGYFAMYLNQPIAIVLTILASLATYFIVRLLSTFVIVYGKRRTVLMIIVGYMVRAVFDLLPYVILASPQFNTQYLVDNEVNLSVIGYVIPGLVAIWMDRQGLIETLSTLITASVVVRLILILIFGIELAQ